MERYDAHFDTWTAVADFSQARANFYAVTIGPLGIAEE
jgi:hypothetical protein